MKKLIAFALLVAFSGAATAEYLDRVFFSLPSNCKVTSATGELKPFEDAVVDYYDSGGARTALLSFTTSQGKAAYQYDVKSRDSSQDSGEVKAELPGVKEERFLNLTVQLDGGAKVLSGKVTSYMPAFPKDPNYQGELAFTCKEARPVRH